MWPNCQWWRGRGFVRVGELLIKTLENRFQIRVNVRQVAKPPVLSRLDVLVYEPDGALHTLSLERVPVGKDPVVMLDALLTFCEHQMG